MKSKRGIFAIVLVLGVLVIAAAAFVLWPRGTTQITQQDAVKAFRDDQASTRATDDPAGGEQTGGRSTPRPGVYTYAAEGQEEVKLGPLPAEQRPFPSTVTATAVDAGTGCFTWTSNLFAQHTEETRYCTDPVLRLENHTKHQQVGPLTPTFTMTCDPNELVSATAAEDTDSTTKLTCKLVVGGGPVSVDTTIEGTATRSADVETIEVGDDDVAVTRIAVHFPVSGTINGTWDETTWWSADHVPVRIERTLDLSGPATFKETSRLQLTSLEPTA